ncbi:MAG: radical SAM protein, partial [Acidobacteriota bacterium]
PEHAPPLGISYLAACLEVAGYCAVARDLYYTSWEDVKELLNRTPSRMIGVSCLTDQRASAFRLLRMARALQPAAVIVAGGIHPTLFGRRVFQAVPCLDAIVLGEAEETIVDFVARLHDRFRWGEVPGLIYQKEGGEVVQTSARRFTRSLDALPMPAYRHYLGQPYVKPLWLSGLRARGKDASELRYVNVLGSRGCTHRCLFCASPASLGRRWHTRRPQYLVAELESLTHDWGYEFIAFSDEVFTEDPAWAMEVCREIVAKGVECAWECQARADSVTPELLDWMKRAGCLMVAFGIESFSERVLRKIRKDITPEEAMRGLDMCQGAGIAANVLLMVGNPGETDDTVEQTRRCVLQIGPHAVSPDITTVFPGTGLNLRAKRAGMLTDDFWIGDEPAPYYTLEHPIERLRAWYDALLDCNADSRWFRQLVNHPTPETTNA